jgi:general secretion pathway protein G
MNYAKSAFTLVEILIIVVALCILTTIMIPQFSDASEDLKLSNLISNLQSIRTHVDMYRMHHNELYPTNLIAQITGKTDINGKIDSSGIFGPYLHMFPANPFVEDPAAAIRTGGKPGDGWYYDPETGVIIPNTPGHEDL